MHRNIHVDLCAEAFAAALTAAGFPQRKTSRAVLWRTKASTITLGREISAAARTLLLKGVRGNL